MSVCQFLGKYILYLFNVLCLLSGVGILTIALIIHQKFYKWPSFVNTEFRLTTPLVLLAIGLGIFVIAFIGLCGVLKDSGCLLTLFSILLTIVLIGEFLLSGAVYFMHNQIESYASDQMNKSIYLYNKTGQETYTKAWDVLQSDLHCCGIKGPDDWKKITHSEDLPSHCCYAIPVNGTCTKVDAYMDGCFNVLETNLQQNSKLIIWTAVGFGLVQLLAVFLACCRKCSIYQEYETV